MTETVSMDTHDGFHVTSNSQTADQLKEQFKDPKAEPSKETPKEAAKAPETPVEGSEQVDEASEPQETDEKPEKPLGKPKNDPRARVMQATRQAAEAKRERDEIERRAIAAETELERLRGGKEPKTEAKPADGADPEPKEDDFESYAQYVKAQARWEARQEFKEQTTAHEQRQQRELALQHQSELFKVFQGRIGAALKADPTLDQHISPDVVELIPKGAVDLSKKLSNEELIGMHCVVEDKGLDMMRHLSDNPDVLQRLRGLSQGSLLVELGRIDARLGSASTAPEPKTQISRANPPVRPVTAVAPSGDTEDVDPNLDFDSWAKATERKRLRELKAQRG